MTARTETELQAALVMIEGDRKKLKDPLALGMCIGMIEALKWALGHEDTVVNKRAAGIPGAKYQ